jgi:hypothetical protein
MSGNDKNGTKSIWYVNLAILIAVVNMLLGWTIVALVKTSHARFITIAVLGALVLIAVAVGTFKRVFLP